MNRRVVDLFLVLVVLAIIFHMLMGSRSRAREQLTSDAKHGSVKDLSRGSLSALAARNA